tara:strand:+ start:226 stop:807 length:582 start_codon:yes stop_codon:yes gene_type:complete
MPAVNSKFAHTPLASKGVQIHHTDGSTVTMSNAEFLAFTEPIIKMHDAKVAQAKKDGGPDDFFDELETIFGNTDGYAVHLKQIKELKKRKDELEAWVKPNAYHCRAILKENEELKEKNKKLKEEINEWEEEVSSMESVSERLEWDLNKENEKLQEKIEVQECQLHNLRIYLVDVGGDCAEVFDNILKETEEEY